MEAVLNLQTMHKMLEDEIESLPEALVQEVFDFVLFVKARYAEETFLWQQVKDTQDYRQRHPEEVVTVTPEQWEALTAHLEEV